MNHAQIERLRERLLRQGRPSIVPGAAPATRPAGEASPLYGRLLPFAEAMYLVMAADSSVSERERDALRGALRILTDGVLSSAAMETMLAEFERALARDGIDQRLDQVASALYGDREDKELALALMAAVASVDAGSDARVRTRIEALAERFSIVPARVRELLEPGA